MSDKSVRRITTDEMDRITDRISDRISYNIVSQVRRQEIKSRNNIRIDYASFTRVWLFIFFTVIMSLLLTGIINIMIKKLY